MKILELVNKYGTSIILFLVLVLFFRTCGMNNNAEKYHELQMTKIEMLDSLIQVNNQNISKIATEETFKNSIDENMWNFLELEELADKQGITISELKHRAKGTDKDGSKN